jgi:hypothetical protein
MLGQRGKTPDFTELTKERETSLLEKKVEGSNAFNEIARCVKRWFHPKGWTGVPGALS